MCVVSFGHQSTTSLRSCCSWFNIFFVHFFFEPHPWLSHPTRWWHWALSLQDGGSGGQSGHLKPERFRSRSGSGGAIYMYTIDIYIYIHYTPSCLLTDLQTCHVERSLCKSFLGYTEASSWCRILGHQQVVVPKKWHFYTDIRFTWTSWIILAKNLNSLIRH